MPEFTDSHPAPLELRAEPIFAPEAQETFTAGSRVYVIVGVVHTGIGEGAEGTYRGHLRERLAVIDFDTPSGEPYRASIPFDAVRNLYR